MTVIVSASTGLMFLQGTKRDTFKAPIFENPFNNLIISYFMLHVGSCRSVGLLELRERNPEALSLCISARVCVCVCVQWLMLK